MARVLRNYQHEDFTELLKSLNTPSPENEVPVVKITDDSSSSTGNEIISYTEVIRRKRESSLNNKKIKYVLDTNQELLHDKDCSLVSQIPGDSFEVSEDYAYGYKICPICKRNAFIRRGIGEDMKRIGNYLLFFKKAKVSDELLERCFFKNDISAHLESPSLLQLHFKEDSWKIQLMEDGHIQLWHNDYIIVPDGSRHFTGSFHLQYMGNKHSFSSALHIIYTYNCKKHSLNGDMPAASKKQKNRKN